MLVEFSYSLYFCNEYFKYHGMKKVLLVSALSLMISVGVQAQRVDSLRMDSIIHNLPDVIVKGERPIAKVNGSTVTYGLPLLLKKRAVDNMYDAIKEIPGVIEQDKKLSLGGMPTTVILDGKVTSMTVDEVTSLLKSMPANRIAKVDVMYNAPAKMQVRGALINIRLRHSHIDGISPLQGEINLAWKQQHDAEFGERTSLLYYKGKFSLDLMYQHSHGDSYAITDERSRHRLDDGTIHDINLYEVERGNGYGHIYRLGMDYNFSENHQLSLVYNGEYHKSNVIEDISGNVLGTAGLNSHHWLHDLRLDYSTPFGFKVGAEITYSHRPEVQHLASTLPTGALKYTVDNDQQVNRWKCYLSQEHTLKNNWSINYGAIYSSSINHTNQQYVEVKTTTGDQPSSEYTRLKEDDINVYFGLSKNFGSKLMMDASVAAEYYHTPIWHQWNCYPTFNLTYVPKPGQMFQLGLSSDREYPDYWEMTNFTSYSNGGYNEITGNPELKPTSDYQLTLVYLLKDKYQFTAWFDHDEDYFVQTPYQRHDRLAVSYKNLNFNFQQQAGIQATLPLRWNRWLDTQIMLTGVWQREKADHFYDIPFDRSVFYGIVKLNNTVVLSSKPDITLSADGYIRSKTIQATYDLPGSSDVDMSARWQFLKKHAILKVYCNDLFETSGINPHIDFKGQDLKMSFSCYRTFGISFTYKFGGYKEKSHEAVDKSRFKQ